jgi:serine/threonine-protein kinase
MQIRSVPGWRAELYAAPNGPVPKALDDSWTRVGGGQVRKTEQRFNLSTDSKRYRYYLVWITALPQGADHVEIAEIVLSAPRRAGS